LNCTKMHGLTTLKFKAYRCEGICVVAEQRRNSEYSGLLECEATSTEWSPTFRRYLVPLP